MEVREASAKYLPQEAEGCPAGYKETEVGVFPADWDMVLIGEMFTFKNGLNKAKEFFGYGTPIVNYMDVFQNPGLWLKALQGRVDVSSNEKMAYEVRKGDVFFTRTSETIEEIGISSVMLDDAKDTVFSGFILRARPLDEGLHNEFKKYVFSARYVRSQVRARASYTTRALTNGRSLSSTIIARPPLTEQQAIASALSDADALIESLSQLLAKKRQIKQGAMQELLTGKRRLPGFSGEWEVKRFGDIAKPRKDRVDPKRAGLHDFCVELEHIEQASGRLTGHTETTDSSSLKSVFNAGDVLFGKLRAYLRKYWLANRAGVCSTEIWVLEAKQSELVPGFLFQLVMVDEFVEVASTAYGTHMPRSDWNVVQNYEVNLPALDEQRAIAEVLLDMDEEILGLENKLAKARQLKQGMMQALLTGRIRLV